jgi:3',5'-cyclic AMP phosphodiesterase CpdA
MTRSRSLGGGLILATIVATLLGGCEPVIGSATTGQLIEPAREREHPLTEIAEDCGTPTIDGSLLRRPYIQRVTDSAASILWTSLGDAESVEVWEPGAMPRMLPSQQEETTFLVDATQRFVRVEDLEPFTVHCYQVVRDGEVVFGPSGFHTAPDPGDMGAIDVLAFGDSGQGNDAQLTLRSQMDTVPADLILHVGDIAYGQGTLEQFESYHFDVYEELFEALPFYPTIGNHDEITAEAGPYLELFDLPTNAESADPSDLERRYSFDWGPAHFVSIDTERLDEEQVAWLERDLAATDRPWKVVFGHHPPYSSGRHGSAKWVRELIQPVLERQGVQLVLSGHDHDYERTEVIGGVTYIVTGAGGETDRVGSSGFTAFATQAMHFVSLHIDGEELRGYAVDGTGRVFDSFRLTP